MISSVHIANHYRSDLAKQSNVSSLSEFSFSVRSTSTVTKTNSTTNVPLGDAITAAEAVVSSQWAYLKEIITKRFKVKIFIV